jgi:hypothetical protein
VAADGGAFLGWKSLAASGISFSVAPQRLAVAGNGWSRPRRRRYQAGPEDPAGDAGQGGAGEDGAGADPVGRSLVDNGAGSDVSQPGGVRPGGNGLQRASGGRRLCEIAGFDSGATGVLELADAPGRGRVALAGCLVGLLSCSA